MHTRKAHTLVEMILVVVILAALALVVVPRLQFGAQHRLEAEGVARKIVADLRLTRRLAISDAATNSKGFKLTMVGPGPYTGYEIENADTSETLASHTIDARVTCYGDNKFGFGPLGNISDQGHTQLTVSAEGRTFTITIVPATGIVKCVEH
ncbi:MAG: hypothetical protein JSU70_11760 [Phycisphaerales bacterium]|nr:MAG: hypothetical protein JSU70_11760 [Phycisphaerales bacterium]